MTTTEAHADRDISEAIYEALLSKRGWLVPLAPLAPPPPRPTYQPTLPGVYANLYGLRAYFFRRVNGHTKNIHVATGKKGVFTLEEESRLHDLWKEACAAWDAKNRPGKPSAQPQDER